MAYGLSTRAPNEQATFRRSTAKSWKGLDEARRMALVERALNPANDFFDAFPVAL